MKKADIKTFFETLKNQRPNPRTELKYSNHYTLLVAVVLSAQSTDVGVNKATKNLFPTVNTPQKMLDLGEAGLKEHIKTIGLYNNKAKNVIALSEILVNEYDGDIPATRKELMSLPGVGRKTANVVLNVAFGEPTMAVDTHIFRVSNRTKLAPGKTPKEVELKLLKRIPDDYMADAHHWLILHGRYTCKARNPQCSKCKVFDVCGFKDKINIKGEQSQSA